MKFVLDTHTLIWAVDDPLRLSPRASAALQDPANDLLVSSGTIWEMAIKVAIGKLSLSLPYTQWMTQAMGDLGATLLPIAVEHAGALLQLPNHHRDPFDRLFIAQAMVESVPIVSGDPAFDPYSITRLW